MKIRALLILSIMACLPEAHSQQLLQWNEIHPSGDKQHPDIRYFQAAGRISGDTVTAFYSISQIGNAELVFYPIYSERNMKPESYLAEHDDIVFLTNAGYFGTNVSYSLVLNNYVTLAPNARSVSRTFNGENTTYYPTRSAFGMFPGLHAECGHVYTLNNNDTWIYPEASQNSVEQAPLPRPDETYPEGGSIWQVSEAVGGGPLLLKDSTFNTDIPVELFGAGITASIAPRTAIGITGKNELINLVVDGRQEHSEGVTLEDLADILLELGCIEAINLDGGGSSCMYIGDSLINEPSDGSTRSIPSVVAIKKATLLRVDNASDFTQISSPVTIVNSKIFSFENAALFGKGSGGWFKFKNISPAWYRIEFPFHPEDSDHTPDSLYYCISGSDTNTVILNNIEESSMLYLNILPLCSGDSLLVFNKEEGKSLPVRGLRIFSVTSGKPEIDLIPQDYYDTYTLGDKVKLTFRAQSKHPDRMLNKYRIYELSGGVYSLLDEKILDNTEDHIDSIEYTVYRDVDQVKLIFAAFDELNDSATVSYAINLDNTPPLIGFGKNSILEGVVGDTLVFELRAYPANENRPLESIDITLFPDADNTLIDELTPSPEGDTIFYEFKLKKEHDPGLIFRFQLKDVKGYTAYQDYSIAVNPVLYTSTDYITCYFNASSHCLEVALPDELKGSGQVSVFDINGKLIYNVNTDLMASNSFKLYGIEQGVYVYQICMKSRVVKGKFIVTD